MNWDDVKTLLICIFGVAFFIAVLWFFIAGTIGCAKYAETPISEVPAKCAGLYMPRK